MWERTWRVKNGKQVCRWKISNTKRVHFPHWTDSGSRMLEHWRIFDHKYKKAVSEYSIVIERRLMKLVERKRQQAPCGGKALSSFHCWWSEFQFKPRDTCEMLYPLV